MSQEKSPEKEDLPDEDKNPKITYVKKESPEEYNTNIRKRIEMVLELASAGGEPITYHQYEMAVLQQPRKGSEVLLRRDIDEIFISNYNSEWIVAWDANLDISPVYDYFGIITYITDYFTKDSTGLTEVLKTAMNQLSKEDGMWEKCNALANHFMTHRQVGEMEAIYKLLAHMNMTYSNVACIYVPTEAKAERRPFLQRQDPDGGKGFKLKDREGLFLEKPDLISKYERRKLLASKEENEDEDNKDEDPLDNLSLCQFVKMYESKGWQKINEEGEYEEIEPDANPDEGALAEEDDFNYIVTGEEVQTERKKLPQTLTLADLLPGEPNILRKRTFPRAIRFFKKRFQINPHKFYLAELMLYHPFRDEAELHPDDAEKCEQLYLKYEDKIKRVKARLMPFLESVDEAQKLYQENREQDKRDIEDIMGADLDPEKEQEVEEAGDEDDEEHPDYYHIDTDQVQGETDGEKRRKQIFKAIALPDRDTQVRKA